MLQDSLAFSGCSVRDMAAAKDFHTTVLGLQVVDGPMGTATIELNGGGKVLLYQKDDHQPASYTILNFPVTDVDAAVAELKGRGVTFEIYEGMGQDENGIMRGHGPDIAWFTDPSGNIMAVLKTD